jgi:hypothetical protein
MQVTALAVSAFQAGHEGSIPLARSNQKPRLRAVETVRRIPTHGRDTTPRWTCHDRLMPEYLIKAVSRDWLAVSEQPGWQVWFEGDTEGHDTDSLVSQVAGQLADFTQCPTEWVRIG